MKVLHLNAADRIGGASRSTNRLHWEFRRRGVESSLYVAKQLADDEHVHLYHPKPGMAPRVRRLARKEIIKRSRAQYGSPKGFEHFHDDRTEFGAEVIEQLPEADVLHLHWINEFIDYKEFFGPLPKDTPMLWTMHDMNPFTGGCHFDDFCGRFAEGCGPCPQLASQEAKDLSTRVMERKLEALEPFDPAKVRFVAPSRWMLQAYEQSPMAKRFPGVCLHNGIDMEEFRPLPERTPGLRQALGITPEQRVILFVADHIGNRRKGFAYLDEALGKLPHSESYVLVSLGKGSTKASSLPHHHLGNLDCDELMALVYGMADVFVIASIQDNLPNTVLEALSCGTPVVGFDTGGVGDLVVDGMNGRLVPLRDTSAMAEAIREITQDREFEARLSQGARAHLAEHFTLPKIADQHLALMGELACIDTQPFLSTQNRPPALAGTPAS